MALPLDELALPEGIRRKASVSPGGEYAWRMSDVEETISAARTIGLACLGGQVQWQFPDGTCEAYWLSYDSTVRWAGEAWQDYVTRSTDGTAAAFQRLCRDTDFRGAGREWSFIRQKMEQEGSDPNEYLWLVLYFVTEASWRSLQAKEDRRA